MLLMKSIPLELFSGQNEGIAGSNLFSSFGTRLGKMLRMIRLVRLLRIVKAFRKSKDVDFVAERKIRIANSKKVD